MEQRALHGDLVGYGVLVQLVLDDGEERAVGLSLFLRRIGIPVCLGDLGLGEDDALLGMALRIAADFPDMANLPYPVDAQRLYEAVLRLERLP